MNVKRTQLLPFVMFIFFSNLKLIFSQHLYMSLLIHAIMSLFRKISGDFVNCSVFLFF